ncbi:hypothetical protein A2781_04735 [Candidatus Gottesmanbacteria bacterium RIFCSPHIGHO2_01_FULL_42_27]|nr:MAG: hypothetical protein A2781_04735 [Candidatus Gottesmanbacteria bacterium RIFCSPHIGHO2_01_FULL_42_27]OGG21684.1 MAG: hypothetical protein A3E72_04400 [Candidatus Gottesmanbacteria bacterium RIFCSPHIGHO2_12_FULL_43_26]OGG34223.1 MAG: hypothetical protein A3G68_02865 [Candidatus Gottesmanbacteria bacterium RIFCSPLOWO2_12_FULL_42_10]OGG35021.1 MAG: hypothetical protein A2968_00100 [Candidatus Gottesmanbacteria bacterium RIFCSPLOWO2_01_FULL_42_22]
MKLFELLTHLFEWLLDHPITALIIFVGIVVTVVLIVISVKWARGGPRSLVIFAVSILFFGVFFLCLVVSIIFSSWVGTYLANLVITRYGQTIEDAENILPDGIQSAPTPGSGGNDGGGQSWLPGPYVIDHASGSSTLREGSSAETQSLGEIPNGTSVEVIEFQDSNCLDEVCFRAHIKAQGNFPEGWVHASTLKKP